MFSYDEALEYIHGLNRFGTKLGLHNISKLLEILENPQEGMKIIHVAGTNGKGSTCSMIDAILRAAGYKVGLYTSPFLEVFNERMRINGENIPNDDLVRLTIRVKEASDFMRENDLGSPTEFEVVTAIGFMYFKEQRVDFLVLEVGMGGRLDATNVVKPLVSVITPISYDHQQYLGETLTDIAREKCGIIKDGIPVVTAPQEPEAKQVIEEVCIERNCSLVQVAGSHDQEGDILYRVIKDNFEARIFNLETKTNIYKDMEIGLLGAHQMDNAATAVAAIEALGFSGTNVDEESIYSGLKSAKWPGRLEVLRENPTVIIDGAHNIAGVRTLKAALEKYFPGKHKILVLGILGDKDFTGMLKELIPLADTVIATSPDNPRALSAVELSEVITKMFSDTITPCESCRQATGDVKPVKIYSRQNIDEAVTLAYTLANPDEMIVFAGSLYMIGSARTIIKKFLS